jgi:AraC family transcriptional regulator
MAQADWAGADKAGMLQFRLRAMSDHRGWTGFEAALLDTSPGFLEHTKMATHNVVSMQVGPPVSMSCRCEGPIDHRLQLPGDIDFMPMGSAATWENQGPTAFLCVCIDNSLVRSTAEALGLNADRLEFGPQLQIKDPRVAHIGWALKTELEAEDPPDRLYAEGLGVALTAHLIRRFARVVRGAPAGGLSGRQLHAVTDYIEAHLASNLSLHELAALAGLSASHFKLLFKRSTGVPPHQFVIQRRVRRAADMLARGAPALSDVAQLSGFADQSHMARCMRRVLGVTPSVLLRQIR